MTTAMDAVATVTAGVARTYALNAVPASPTYPYGSFSAALGQGDVYLLDSSEGIRHGRIVHQSFGRTAASALDKAEDFRTAVVGVSLAITGYSTTPVRAELDPAVTRDPDTQGVVDVTTTYTFTATKE